MSGLSNPYKKQDVSPLSVIILILFLLSLLVLSFNYITLGFSQLLLICIIVVLTLYPYFERLSIPGLLELRKEVGEIKKEQNDLKVQVSQIQLSSQNVTLYNLNSQMAQAVKRDRELRNTVSVPAIEEYEKKNLEIPGLKNIIAFRDSGQFVLTAVTLKHLLENTFQELVVHERARRGDSQAKSAFLEPFEKTVQYAERAEVISSNLAERSILINHTLNLIIHSLEPILPNSAKDVISSGISIIIELNKIMKSEG